MLFNSVIIQFSFEANLTTKFELSHIVDKSFVDGSVNPVPPTDHSVNVQLNLVAFPVQVPHGLVGYSGWVWARSHETVQFREVGLFDGAFEVCESLDSLHFVA